MRVTGSAPADGRPAFVVALVCSAGGLEPVETILAGLPGDFPAALIVLRHQVPRADDLMVRILGRRTRMPVAPAQDGRPLCPSEVLVAPPGRHTLVTPDEHIALIVSGERPPYRPSADLLLTSMALALGPRAVAVILSGYGNDAATGATAIHRFGGVVIASDEATSHAFSMPKAAIERDEVVDRVAPVTGIAALLTARAAANGRAGEAAVR